MVDLAGAQPRRSATSQVDNKLTFLNIMLIFYITKKYELGG